MSTAEYERLVEIRGELEEIRDAVDFITTVVSIAVLTALFYALLSGGGLKRLLDV